MWFKKKDKEDMPASGGYRHLGGLVELSLVSRADLHHRENSMVSEWALFDVHYPKGYSPIRGLEHEGKRAERIRVQYGAGGMIRFTAFAGDSPIGRELHDARLLEGWYRELGLAVTGALKHYRFMLGRYQKTYRQAQIFTTEEKLIRGMYGSHPGRNHEIRPGVLYAFDWPRALKNTSGEASDDIDKIIDRLSDEKRTGATVVYGYTRPAGALVSLAFLDSQDQDDEEELQEYLDELQLQQVIAGIREGRIKTTTLGLVKAELGIV